MWDIAVEEDESYIAHGFVNHNSSDPNLTNIPAKDKVWGPRIRGLFIAGFWGDCSPDICLEELAHVPVPDLPPDFPMTLIVSDFSQIELCVCAHESGDERMVEAIRSKQDLHCKTVVFASELGAFGLPHGVTYEQAKAAKDATDIKGYVLNAFEEMLVLARANGKSCVHPDTVIHTNAGMTTILDGVTRAATSSTEAVTKLGDFAVADGRGNNVTARYASALHTQPGFHVHTRRGVLTCSEHHQFELEDGRLVEAKDLKKGDLLPGTIVPLAADAPYPSLVYKLFKRTPPVAVHLDHDVAYFAGMFAGDGYQGGEHQMGISHGDISQLDVFGYSYADWQQNIVASAEKIGLETISKKRCVYLGSRATQRYFNALELMDGHIKRLRVPTWVMRAGKTAILHFLAGLMDTDGTAEPKAGALSITTKDPIFAGQVAVAIRACGLRVGCEPCWNKTYLRWYYRIRVRAADCPQLKEYMRHPGKRARFRAVAAHGQHENRVMLVEPAGEIPCLDLNVQNNDHLYLTSGLLTHNTIFGIIYGIGAVKLGMQLGLPILRRKGRNGVWRDWCPEGEELINSILHEIYPDLGAWIEETHEQCHDELGVYTFIGHPRRLPDIVSSDGGRSSQARRQSVNTKAQGGAADIVIAAMLRCEGDRRLRELGVRMLLQIHDELVFECPDIPEVVAEATARIKVLMEDPTSMRVPIRVGIGSGPTWSSAKR